MGEPSEPPGKRRRILACERCRHVKVRCEFDRYSGDCKRCQRLRLDCSLIQEPRSEVSDAVRSTQAPAPGFESLNMRLDRHENLLVNLRAEVKTLTSQLQKDTSTDSSSQRGDESATAFTSEKDWYGQPTHAPDTATNLAPVNIIRRQYPGRSGIERLLDATDDIVIQGILTEEQALRLEQVFLRRCGPWLQIEDWAGMGNNLLTIRNKSSLLFAVCCLQGCRLDDDFCNSPQHYTLYEYVRKAMQRLFLISPLPIDACLALLIMTVWSTSPEETSEFIDSWVLSGYIAQQEMLNLSFTRIISSLRSGVASPLDRLSLRLWNSTCLCHLQYAIGTGRPPTIAKSYIEQARTIIDSFEASAYDSYELAGIAMLMLTEEILSDEVFTKFSHVQRAVGRWQSQWQHLFEIQDDRFCAIKLTYSFCQLVITRRALEEHRAVRQRPSHASEAANGGGAAPSVQSPTTTAQENNNTSTTTPGTTTASTTTATQAAHTRRRSQDTKLLLDQWTALSRENALQLVETFGRLPGSVVRELPDFFYLAVTYGMTVLAHFIYKPPASSSSFSSASASMSASSSLLPPAPNARSVDDMAAVLQDSMAHGSRTGSKTMRLFELTITRLAEALETHPGDGNGGGTGGSASLSVGGVGIIADNNNGDRPPGVDAGLGADVLGFSDNWVTPDLEALFNDMLPDFLVPRA